MATWWTGLLVRARALQGQPRADQRGNTVKASVLTPRQQRVGLERFSSVKLRRTPAPRTQKLGRRLPGGPRGWHWGLK